MSIGKVFSSTKWETSHFGGYRALILDHPEVHVDWDVEYEVHKHKDLSYYSGSKLIDIFLLKAKQYNQVPLLSEDPEIIEKKSMFGFGDKKIAQVNKANQRLALENIIKSEKEYRALFLHYTETILSADIQLKLPDDKKKDGPGEGGEGVEKKPGSAKSKGGPRKKSAEQKKKDLENAVSRAGELLSKALDDIRKRERITPDNITGALKKKTTWKYPVGAPSKNPFTKEQERHAQSLVRLLDINFDPTIEKLNSLRNGKLDARKISEVPAGNLNVYYKIEPNQTTKPFSVVLLVDESGSMGSSIECARDCVKTLYLAFSEIVPPSKLSVYGHSGGMHPEIYVYKDPYHDNFASAIETMASKSENYDGPVIESIYERVRGYSDDNIIFIVMSDGEPCGDNYGGVKDNTNLKRIVEKCRRDGFVTVGIGIFHDTSHLYDYNCIVESLGPEMVKKTSYIINNVVKKEFQ